MSKVPIPDDWDGTSYCCHVIEWPDSPRWLAILFGLISWPARGRFWDERTGTILDAMAIGQNIFDRNAPGECIMGCLEDIIAQLQCICTAIQNSGIGATPPEAATGSYPDPGLDGGTPGSEPPPGYEEGVLVDQQKCDMSNWYWGQLLNVITQFRTYNVLGWLTFGVAAAISTIISVLTLGATQFFMSIFSAQLGSMVELAELLLETGDSDLVAIQDALAADQQGFVCALYISSDVGNAKEEMGDWAQAAGLTAFQLSIIDVILNNYVLNGLFFPNTGALAAADEMAGKVSCEGCGVCDFAFAEIGNVELVDLNGQQALRITPDPGESNALVFLNTYDDGEGGRDSCIPLEFYLSIANSGQTASVGVTSVGFYDHSNNNLATYNPAIDPVPNPRVCYGRIDVTYSTPGSGYYILQVTDVCSPP